MCVLWRCIKRLQSIFSGIFISRIIYRSSEEMATNQGQGRQQSLTATLPKALPIYFLKQITNEFSSEIGRSPFGGVYKV
jgi:hypothetical protein